MTRVSFCIANHNYGQYVAQAIESSLQQTHPDVEVIVVDDGSTDDSAAVLGSFGDRITLILQPNAGQFLSVRRAFEASSGEIVIFLDADDLIDPDTAARVVAALERTPSAARVQWRLRVIGPGGQSTGDEFPPARWRLPDGDLREHVLTRRTYVWPPTSGNAYPGAALRQVLSVIGDETPLIDLILAETTPLIGPVVTLGGTGGSYRWHGGNFSDKARQDMVGYLHDRIGETVENHEIGRRLSRQLGIEGYPADPRTARDWAFAAYRLSSLRASPASHPLAGDRRLAVAGHGIRSVLTQPDYSPGAKAKRALWFASLAVAPDAMARQLIDRAYLTEPTVPTFAPEPDPPAGSPGG